MITTWTISFLTSLMWLTVVRFALNQIATLLPFVGTSITLDVLLLGFIKNINVLCVLVPISIPLLFTVRIVLKLLKWLFFSKGWMKRKLPLGCRVLLTNVIIVRILPRVMGYLSTWTNKMLRNIRIGKNLIWARSISLQKLSFPSWKVQRG